MIFSDNILDLRIGEEIAFITMANIYCDGYRMAIVEVRRTDEMLLSFEDGKEKIIKMVE